MATWGFLALTLLIPRPLMMPVVAWLLWQRRELRLWFALMAAGYLALVAISGLGPEFLAKLTTTSGLVDFGTNVSPSRLIGLWWVPIGVALSVWLTLRGRLGWAALAFSPYLLPNYLLMLVLEWPIQRPMPLRRRLSNRLRERRGPTTG